MWMMLSPKWEHYSERGQVRGGFLRSAKWTIFSSNMLFRMYMWAARRALSRNLAGLFWNLFLTILLACFLVSCELLLGSCLMWTVVCIVFVQFAFCWCFFACYYCGCYHYMIRVKCLFRYVCFMLCSSVLQFWILLGHHGCDWGDHGTWHPMTFKQ